MTLRTYTLRIDEIALDKLHVVASYNGRSVNGQLLYIIRKLIEEYEKEHGEIKIERKKKD